jgi:hypothetical protein
LYGSKEWGIHYLENENCNLLIGDVNDPSNGNLLDFCNWVGIDLSANAGKNTNIIISNNSIINQTWATGIVISEYASIGISPTYNTLRIHKNTMNQIGAGIKLYNIEGWNGTYFGLGPRPHSNDFDANNLIDSNTINFTTVWEPHNQIGIQTTNSNKLNIHYNIVNSQDGGDWRNTGILTDDAYQTSIYKNICTGGSGIRIGGNMMLSNVYCNDLPNSFTGIFINYCYLRSVGDLHGILNSQARLNTFPSTLGGFDMRMYYSNNDLNQWVFNTSVPTIDYTFASGTLPTIDGGYGNNVCSPEPIIGTGETFQMKSVINNGTSKNTVTKSTILNPSLVNFKKPISKYGKINVIKSNLKNAKDSLAINTKRNDFAYRIAKVNELILNKKIDSALTILNNSNSLDSIENELLFVYRTLVNLQKSKKKLSPKQQEQIIEIARKNQYTQSIASPFARIIAKQELHLDIYDSLEFVPSIYGKINQNCTTPILEGLKVNLLTQTNKETGIFAITDSLGNFTINGLQLNSLNAQLNYKFSCLLPDSSFAFSLPTKIGSFMQMKLVDVVCQTILAKKKIQEGKAFIFTEPKVFPNPSNGKYIIEGAENSKLIVFNILGEIIYSEFVSSKTEINLSQYPKGIYFLNLVGEKQHSFKLILE